MIFNISDGALKTPELNASYPANATVKSGTNATFKVEVSKDGIPSTYTYQWYVNDTAVSGATGATYTRSTSSDKGVYSVYCKVTNKAGTVVSRTATLTVNKTPVLNTSYPANASVTVNKSVTVKVAVSTAGYPTSYTYQWYKNGSAVSGATGTSYTFTPTAVGSVTVYCKVTNTAGSVNSRTATITVNDAYLFNNGAFSSEFCPNGVTYSNSNSILENDATYGPSLRMRYHTYFQTNDLIDLTAWKSIEVDIIHRYGSRVSIIVLDSAKKEVAKATSKTASSAIVHSLSLDGISGTYYIKVQNIVDDASDGRHSRIGSIKFTT